MDLKDKIVIQQNQHDREDILDRYQAMDQNVKIEFQRKDEAIHTL